MHVVAVVGFNGDDAFWYVVAGVLVAVGSALVFTFRRVFRWTLTRLKEAFKEWFGEAVDEHVEPKFSQLRDETISMAAQVKTDLKAHTDDEGDIVREIFRTEIAPVMERLDSHVSHDDRVMAAAGDALVQGQASLQRQMREYHDESMATIKQHVESDEAAFERIETKLGTEGAP